MKLSNEPNLRQNEKGSAVVDFVFVSFGLLATFASVMAIITNLYLRTVMTSAATDAARLMARADISSGCEGPSKYSELINLDARQKVESFVGSTLVTTVSSRTQQDHKYCAAEVTIATSLPGLPLMPSITHFEASAHATLELQ